MKENLKKISFWPILSAVLFFALLAVLIFPSKTMIDSKEIMNKEKAGEKAIEFINSVFLQGQDQVELKEVSKESGVYKIKMVWGLEEIDSYVTQDGKILFPEAFKIDEFSQDFLELDDQEEFDGEEIIIEEDLEKQNKNTEESSDEGGNIENLISCLKEKKFVIYGAEWCSFCRDLVSLFGGYEKAASIYVECTEKQDLCREKNITAYPTILVNDQQYRGERTLEAFASETKCSFN
jgi:thiol-disulfide isomerase/thioredoxin